MFEEAFVHYVCATRFSFIFDRLYLMAHVSSGNGKGVIFLSFDSSFMWCEQFCRGISFYFNDRFLLYYLGQKFRTSLEQYLLALYLNVFYIVALLYRVSWKKLLTFKMKQLWKYGAKKVSLGVFEMPKCIVTLSYKKF